MSPALRRRYCFATGPRERGVDRRWFLSSEAVMAEGKGGDRALVVLRTGQRACTPRPAEDLKSTGPSRHKVSTGAAPATTT
jgi:hypothetical protein